jgi:saccharopine dehydrogenase (NADP+, L-glutamate forming)
MQNSISSSPKNKQILVLGSGLVSEPCVDYLLKREENIITIASNNLTEAKNLIENLILHVRTSKESKEKIPDRLQAIEIDITKDKLLLYKLVGETDLVISLVPSFFHIFVVQACLDLNKNLLTTSYIPEDIKKINKKVAEKNLTFLYEIGVSPGLDHIIAHKVVREQEQLNNQIIAFESWVGAIPSPECIDNPLLYKFSWDPKGALLTLTYDAKQLINGKVITIQEKNLLTTYLVDKKFHPSLNLEGYYNRNSVRYKELYNLKHAKSVIRGNIRYQGFTFVIQCFKFLNLFSQDKISEKTKTWRDHLNKILKNPRIQDNIYEIKNKYIKKGLEMFVYNNDLSDSLVERIFYFNLSLLALSYFDDRYIRKYGFENLFNRIYSVLLYLELYKEDNKVNNNLFRLIF